MARRLQQSERWRASKWSQLRVENADIAKSMQIAQNEGWLPAGLKVDVYLPDQPPPLPDQSNEDAMSNISLQAWKPAARDTQCAPP